MVFSFKFISYQFKMAMNSASGSVGKVSGGPAGAFWMALLSFGSCDRLRPQASQPNQVLGRPSRAGKRGTGESSFPKGGCHFLVITRNGIEGLHGNALLERLGVGYANQSVAALDAVV